MKNIYYGTFPQSAAHRDFIKLKLNFILKLIIEEKEESKTIYCFIPGLSNKEIEYLLLELLNKKLISSLKYEGLFKVFLKQQKKLGLNVFERNYLIPPSTYKYSNHIDKNLEKIISNHNKLVFDKFLNNK